MEVFMARIRIPMSYETARAFFMISGLVFSVLSIWNSFTNNALNGTQNKMLLVLAGIHLFFTWLVYKEEIDISKKWSFPMIIWGIASLGTIFIITI
jgi:hypothetical protein